ncbi:hypothetical protein GQX73_g667 [Xylaria multiplex]|uniref:Alpha/beta hydrolase fold-3 domain-containing protein n=1 Tax=Xylaria multiplex TaxID=323545 RepID=A0A7C8NDS4_9PEZI|nr:hypothetical protein GQX73_g667 [Xylaria multiplex]
MPLTSDITINYSRFDPNSATEDAKKYSEFLERTTSEVPKWYEVGAPRFREIIEAGEFGGLKLGPVDGLLKFYANTIRVTAMSIGYRLAPEHPWPAAREDSIDVAEYLVDAEESEHGGKLLFLAGESGDANLTMVTALHLIRARPQHVLKGLVLPYGNYTVALGLPSMVSFDKPTPEERRNPLVSPLFEDLRALASQTLSGRLPPALFICGTNDPLLDDTLFMSVKWQATGSETIVKIFPGAPHVFNVPSVDIGKESFAYEAEFLLDKLGSAV